MQVLGSRRGGLVTLAIAAVALIAAVAFAVWQLAGRPSVEAPLPGPGSAVSDPTPRIAFTVPSGTRLADLHVMLDGRDVTARVHGAGDQAGLTPGKALDEGDHQVQVTFSTDNVFARTVTRDWTFTVDTTAPKLAVATPSKGALSPRTATVFSGTAEPGATVVVAAADRNAKARADAKGAWRVVARLPDGRVRATVTATDAAGNATVRRRGLTVDTTAPQLALTDPAAGARITDTDAPSVYGNLPKDDPRGLTFTASVNGTRVSTVKGTDGVTPEDVAASYGDVASTSVPLQVDGHRFAMALGTLPQGRNTISVKARDRAGNTTTATRVVVVDSTDEFGSVDIGRGARGADVTDLQTRLREAKVYPKKARLTGVVDATTMKSIARYQKRYHLPRTGIVDARTRTAMVGRLVVSLTQRKVRLIRNGKVIRTYPVAIGQPAYPTPTGEYEINDKQKDPVWYPPDSPWAAELSSIPAGPGNPLGTRWIGTTAPAIGLHGTYADSSVGQAASHGCMRMHIKDVEALYDLVTIGMKISIRP
ncbi:MAG TPA: L,D-transpeptidase family protein [Miltoncostaea sp.]|nr:L,D-transpeptidase family protein [Miltoncostaea sp.]